MPPGTSPLPLLPHFTPSLPRRAVTIPPVPSPLPFLPTSSPPIPATAPVSLEAVAGLLRGLDRAQRRAVTHGDGPLLVLGGPGTRKTRVVTHRIALLIATKRARAE